jgi:hypothetical protein
VDRWNWGAFLLAPIWIGIHGLWVPLALLAAFSGVALIPNQTIQAAAGVGSLLFTIWLARRGNAMAWRKRRWESVEHFRHVQRRWAQWGLVALIGLFAIGVWSAVRVGAPGEFRAHDVAFDYPHSWELLESPGTLPGLSLSQTPLWIEAVGQDEDNGVLVTALDLGEEITEQELVAERAEIAESIERSVASDGLNLIGPVTFARLGSLPAFQFSATTPQAENVRLRAVLGYQGHLLFTVVCIAVPPGDEELREGCEQIISTFRVTGDSD